MWSEYTNRQTYLIPQCRCDTRKYSFFPRTVKDWNGLDTDAVNSENIDAFKRCVSEALA
jgi:hypothetical protein